MVDKQPQRLARSLIVIRYVGAHDESCFSTKREVVCVCSLRLLLHTASTNTNRLQKTTGGRIAFTMCRRRTSHPLVSCESHAGKGR